MVRRVTVHAHCIRRVRVHRHLAKVMVNLTVSKEYVPAALVMLLGGMIGLTEAKAWCERDKRLLAEISSVSTC